MTIPRTPLMAVMGELDKGFSNVGPMGQIIGGILVFVLGVSMTIYFWTAELVVGLAVCMIIIGPTFFFFGLRDLRERRDLRRQIEKVSKEGKELVRKLVDHKRSGGNPIRLLEQEGIRHIKVRGFLLEEMRSRL
jgi:hypothetical protein